MRKITVAPQPSERLLSHLRSKPGVDPIDYAALLEPYAGVLRSSRAPEYVEAIIAADQRGIRMEPRDVGIFVEALPLEEVIARFDRLQRWLEADDPNTHDGVDFTPVLAEFLSRPGDFEALLSQLDRLKVETHNGRFRFDNPVQKDLEFRRFHHEYAKIAPASRELPYHGCSFAELYEIFSRLDMLPLSREVPLSVTAEQALQARRAAYEAAGLLMFLRDFKSRTDRHVVVVGNTRYGRQWAVEPLEDFPVTASPSATIASLPICRCVLPFPSPANGSATSTR